VLMTVKARTATVLVINVNAKVKIVRNVRNMAKTASR